ncbi:unnamed protein product [Fusarium graminearum]|nr:unnamed protein product [Fusarium graminearum]
MKGTDNQYSSGSSPNDYALGINRELHVAMSESFIFKKTACSNCHKRKVFQPGHYECSLKEPSSSYHVPSGPSGNVSALDHWFVAQEVTSEVRVTSYELTCAFLPTVRIRERGNTHLEDDQRHIPTTQQSQHSAKVLQRLPTMKHSQNLWLWSLQNNPSCRTDILGPVPFSERLESSRAIFSAEDSDARCRQWLLDAYCCRTSTPTRPTQRTLSRSTSWTATAHLVDHSGRPRMINLEDSDVSPPTAADFQEESEGADVFIANIHIVFFVTLIILTNADNPLAAPVTSLIASSFIASMFAEMQEAGDLQRLGPIFAIHSLVAALPLLSAQRVRSVSSRAAADFDKIYSAL